MLNSTLWRHAALPCRAWAMGAPRQKARCGAARMLLVAVAVALAYLVPQTSAYLCPHVGSETVAVTVPLALPVTRDGAAHAASLAAARVCRAAGAGSKAACLNAAQRRAEASVQSVAGGVSGVAGNDHADVAVSLRVNYTTSVAVLDGRISVLVGPADVAADAVARVCASHSLSATQCAAVAPAIQREVTAQHLGHLKRCKHRLDDAGLLNAPLPMAKVVTDEAAAVDAASGGVGSGDASGGRRGDCISMLGDEPGDVARRQRGIPGDGEALAAVAFSLFVTVDSNLCVWVEVEQGETAEAAARRTCEWMFGVPSHADCETQAAAAVQHMRTRGDTGWRTHDLVEGLVPAAYHAVVAGLEAALVRAGDSIREGHSGQSAAMVNLLHDVMQRHPHPRTVCEVGVNAGHSSAIWLTARPDMQTVVYGFDLGMHTYSRPAHGYLKAAFPDRFFVTYGDSVHTVPEFYVEHPDVQCDIVFVDGGHTLRVATADLAHTRLLANRTHHVLLLDDVLPGSEVEQAWQLTERLGQGRVVGEELRADGKAVMVGEFVFT